MTTTDLIYIGVSAAGVLGLLILGRTLRRRNLMPKWPRYRAYLIYNAILLGLLGAVYLAGLRPPGFVAPILVVGGNGIIAETYGLPKFAWRRKGGKKDAAAADPSRQKIVPEARKKRRKRRR